MRRHTLNLAALLPVLASLLAGPAAAQSPRAQDEYRNNGWYTGLEYNDLPSQPAVQNEYRNNGWYTGLEHAAAAAAAMLLATTAVAVRVRHRRVAA